MPVPAAAAPVYRRIELGALRAMLEGTDGPTWVGWAYDADAPGSETFSLRSGAWAARLTAHRVPRADVQQALQADTIGLGFIIEWPDAIWERVAPGANIDLLVNGTLLASWAFRPRLQAFDALRRRMRPDTTEAWRIALMTRHVDLAHGWQERHRTALVSYDEGVTLLEAHVEGWRGLCLCGWSWAEPALREAISVRLGGRPFACPVRRVPRRDVTDALGLEPLNLGFEIEVPGTVWEHVKADAPARLQIHIEDRSCGPVWELSRDDLATRLQQAISGADDEQNRWHALLAAEHIAAAGTFAQLEERQQQVVRDLVAAVGAPGLFATAEPRRRADPHPPSAGRETGLGWWLRRPTIAGMALRALLLLKRLGADRPAVRRRALDVEIALTRHVGLFEHSFYLSQWADGDLNGISALKHYVSEGDAQGAVPMRLFDPRHYTRQLIGGRVPDINRLLHYALHGRHAGLSPCPWFDAAFYRRTYRDIRRRRIDAVRHFVRSGWRGGRSPLPGFDASGATPIGLQQRLLRRGSSLVADPMLDYLMSGLPPATPLPDGDRLPWWPTMRIEGRNYLDLEPWKKLDRPAEDDASVDIVVPVYSGVQETLRCLWTVLTAPQRTRFELVVVDDCSPDPALSSMLTVLARLKLCSLLINDENLGFVRSVNRGLALHADRDVVLLNADTEVHGDWLDRLCAHAAADPKAASITPLSNNATICSYPHMARNNAKPLERSPAEMDRLAAQVNRGVSVRLPTGVGFCMWMRRSCLLSIGNLDAERFGRGYGEENDWCLRASRQGWRQLAAADVYVLHRGSVSFRSEAQDRTAAAIKLLLEHFPDYTRRVAAWQRADPLLPSRARLDIARLRAAADDRPFVLMVGHARGGGTARHQAEQAERLRALGLEVAYLRPAARPDAVSLCAPDLIDAVNLAALELRADDLLAELLKLLQVRQVELHHLADLPASAAAVLPVLCGAIGAPLSVMLHDYHAICPRINLVDASRLYCGEPDAAHCNACLARDETTPWAAGIESWRQQYIGLLRCASTVSVPDLDVATRYARYAPDLAIIVKPHDADLPPVPLASPRRAAGRAGLLVLVIGALSLVKGFDVVAALARSRRARSGGMDIRLLGYSSNDAELAEAGVSVLGRYDDADLLDEIERIDPDLILIPSVWPETYCYVLSTALQSGRRIAVFDLGAQARRLRAADVGGVIMPIGLARDPEALADALFASSRPTAYS